MLKIRILLLVLILLFVISIFGEYDSYDFVLSNQEEKMQQKLATEYDQPINEIVNSFSLGFGDEQEPEIVETMLTPSLSETEILVHDSEFSTL